MGQSNKIIKKKKKTSKSNKKYKVALSVDCVIFGYDFKELKVLLIECNTEPYVGMNSLIGETVMANETLEMAASRVLKMWTGMDNLFLEEVKTFSDLNRHPNDRVITVAYYSLMQVNDFPFDKNNEYGLKWVNVEDVDRLAFDHNEIFKVSLDRLKSTLKERPIGFELLPKKFTIKQLRCLYESVLNIELDRGNFSRKLKSLGLLIDLQENEKFVSHRPGKLFKFNYEEYEKKRSKGFSFEI